MCLQSMEGGRNHKKIIRVKAEGSKGTWAGKQGCSGAAELCVCKQSRHRYLGPTALCKLRFAVSFDICQTGFEDGQQNSPGIKVHLHICVSKWMCMLVHTNPETPGGNKTESVFYKPFVQLLMPWPDCPKAAVLPHTHNLCLFAKASALTACTVLWVDFFSSNPWSIPVKGHRRINSFCSSDAKAVKHDSELGLESLGLF